MFLTGKSVLILTIFISFSVWLPIEVKANATESLVLTKNATNQAETTETPEISDKSLNLTHTQALEPLRLIENLLQASSISYGIAQVANRSFVSDLCFEHLEIFKQNVLHRKSWAMKALDASGSKSAGFVFIHNFWLGSTKACAAVNEPMRFNLLKYIKRIMQPDLIDDVSPFEFRQNVAMLKHNSPWQLDVFVPVEAILHVGLCLPTSCTANEIHQLMQESMQRKLLFITELYEFRPQILYVKDLQLKDEFFQRTSLKILTGLLIFTSVMMLTASYLHNKSAVHREPHKTVSFANGSHHNDSEKVKNTPLEAFHNAKSYINCFHLATNWRKLFATKPYISDDIPVINGLRSVSAFGILSIHVIFFMLHKVQNFAFLMNAMESNSLTLLNVPMNLVDCFFAISGFLTTCNFLKNTKQMEEIRQNHLAQNVKKFFKILFHRYVRLAPLYFVIIAVTDLVTAYLNDVSVFHINDRYHETCPRNWWHNVLFIQSFFGLNEICLSWTWSLSCEMQYFVVATLLLFIYTKHPKLIKNFVIALLTANIVGSLLLGTSAKFQFATESFFLASDAIYINSLVRVVSYIVGSIAAWCFIEHECMSYVNPFIEKFLWKLSVFLLVSVSYTGYWRDVGYLTSISLFTLGHGITAITVCWLIMASATGRNTVWTRLLEAPVFQHVNRLTYAIYLLNPMIINLFASLNQSSFSLNYSILTIYSLGFSVLVYLAAIVFSLAFEIPYCNWSSLILKRNKTKTV